MIYSELSIVTITYDDNSGLQRTIASVKFLTDDGARLIVIDGRDDNPLAEMFLPKDSIYIGELDNGIYEALNKGVSRVSSKYFIILHSGDVLLESGFRVAFDIHLKSMNDLTLNGAQIVNQFDNYVLRTHSPYLWRPWMLNFHVQPPHLGIIYSKNFIRDLHFNENFKIVSDFFFIKKMFNSKPNYSITKILIVDMVAGGKTTNGVDSFFKVSRELAKVDGILKMLLCIPFRVILKNLNRIN